MPIEYARHERRDFGKMLSDAGLGAILGWSLQPEHDLISRDPKRRIAGRDWLLRLIDYASELGATTIAGVNYAGVGCPESQMVSSMMWEEIVALYQKFADHAAEASIALCFEPTNQEENALINTIGQGLDFKKAVGRDNVGLLLDTYHLNKTEMDLVEAIEKSAGHLVHFHASEHHRGLLGSGNIPWTAVRKTLMQAGYSGIIVPEIFLHPSADEALSWETAEQAFSFLRSTFNAA
ncbi:MAG: sugar phosphate isomerase/epimerase [Desulfarculaceae bacterium]|nr:sugar phosphate isomerase/epimerase [Desulfarculaceae bacterium]